MQLKEEKSALDAAELLRRYAAGERQFKGVQLINADLRHANLRGIDLSHADLCFSNLSYAELEGANLTGAKLNGAELVRTNLHRARLEKAQLIGATLNLANLAQANLADAILGGAMLKKANLERANLSRAILGGAIFHGANLSHSTLKDALLAGADLRKATLQGADVSGVELIEGRSITALPDGSFFRPTRTHPSPPDLRRFTGLSDGAELERRRQESQKTALIKEFLKGQFELLSNRQFQVRSTFDALQLWTNSGKLVASLKLVDEERKAIVSQAPDHWLMIDQLLREQHFVPSGPAEHRNYLEYEYQTVPEGYQVNFSEARLTWKTWWNQLRKPAALVKQPGVMLRREKTWQPIQEIIAQRGTLYVTIHQGTEVILDCDDRIVWISSTPIPQDHERSQLQVLPEILKVSKFL